MIYTNLLKCTDNYRPYRLCDVSGFGTAAAGAMSAAATISAAQINANAQDRTNQMNLQIHREDNSFNAHQSQISRDWQEYMTEKYATEKAIMEQKKAAGINPVADGSSAATVAPSGPSASAGTVPNMVAPTPGDGVPDVGQVIDTMFKAQTYGDKVEQTRAQTQKDKAEARLTENYATESDATLGNKIQTSSLNVIKLHSEIRNLDKNSDLVDAKKDNLNQELENLRLMGSEVKVRVMRNVAQLTTDIQERFKSAITTEQFTAQMENHFNLEHTKIKRDSQMILINWKRGDFRESYEFGGTNRFSDQYSERAFNGSEYTLSGGAELGASASASEYGLPAPFVGSVNGSINTKINFNAGGAWTNQKSDENTTSSESMLRTQNAELYQKLSQTYAAAEVLQNATHYDLKVLKHAQKVLYDIANDMELRNAYIEELGSDLKSVYNAYSQ